MRRYLICQFYGYHENGKSTDMIWDIVYFDTDEETISIKALNDKLKHHFSSFREKKQIVFISIQAM